MYSCLFISFKKELYKMSVQTVESKKDDESKKIGPPSIRFQSYLASTAKRFEAWGSSGLGLRGLLIEDEYARMAKAIKRHGGRAMQIDKLKVPLELFVHTLSFLPPGCEWSSFQRKCDLIRKDKENELPTAMQKNKAPKKSQEEQKERKESHIHNELEKIRNQPLIEEDVLLDDKLDKISESILQLKGMLEEQVRPECYQLEGLDPELLHPVGRCQPEKNYYYQTVARVSCCCMMTLFLVRENQALLHPDEQKKHELEMLRQSL